MNTLALGMKAPEAASNTLPEMVFCCATVNKDRLIKIKTSAGFMYAKITRPRLKTETPEAKNSRGLCFIPKQRIHD
jgi:hypothetical protein